MKALNIKITSNDIPKMTIIQLHNLLDNLEKAQDEATDELSRKLITRKFENFDKFDKWFCGKEKYNDN